MNALLGPNRMLAASCEHRHQVAHSGVGLAHRVADNSITRCRKRRDAFLRGGRSVTLRTFLIYAFGAVAIAAFALVRPVRAAQPSDQTGSPMMTPFTFWNKLFDDARRRFEVLSDFD